MDINELEFNTITHEDAKLGDFLTYAPVLLRAQSRRVVAESLVTATADLIPELSFCGLLLLNETGLVESLIAYRDERLLRTEETSRILKQLLVVQSFNPDLPLPAAKRLLDEPLAKVMSASQLYLSPAKTPSRRFGYLLIGCHADLSSPGSQYMGALSELAGIALDNAMRFDDLKEAAHDMSLVNEMAASLAASLNGEELFNSFASRLSDIVPLEQANLILLPPLGTTYNFTFSWNGPSGHTRRLYLKDLELTGSPYEEAINRHEIITGNWNAIQSSGVPSEINIFGPPYQSQMIIPLMAKRQVVGAVILSTRAVGAYAEEHLRRSLLEKLAALFALALLNSRLYEEKQLSAEFDSRIGVYNHDFFDRELTNQMHKARRNEYRLGLMMIDMDNLKLVNDQYGHLAGDAALRHIAILISRTVRTTDVVARYGGDEFGVLLPGCTPLGLEVVAEKTRRAIRSTPLILETGQHIKLTVSIGAVLCPEEALNPRELIQQADAAMYVAKSHRDQVRIGLEARLPSVSEQDLLGQVEHTLSGLEQSIIDAPTQEEYEQILLSLGTATNTVEGRVIHELAGRLNEALRQLNDATETISRLKQGLNRNLQLIAQLVERREPFLAGGVEKLVKLVRLLGEKIALTEEEVNELEAAAWLSNLGRLEIPETVWNRPGPLTAQEWKKVRRLPQEAFKLLGLLDDLLTPGTLTALHFQRERMDGTGYPKRLSGEEIPRLARVLGLASGLVAMSQPRSFRPALGLAECHTQLERAAGRQWDSDLANILHEMLKSPVLDFLDLA